MVPSIIAAGILLALLIVGAGCTQPVKVVPPVSTDTSGTTGGVQSGTATPSVSPQAGTDGATKMVTFTESDNGAIKEIGQGSRFAVILNENPTTGYQWNATVSSGLEIQSVEYRQNDAPPGMTGVGGKRTWILVAKDAGNQKFSGVYKRSWELSTGNETAFAVNVNVVKL